MSRYRSRESELLGNLQEECSEVIKVVSKIMRFTSEGKKIPEEKLEMLHGEIGDVLGILELMLKDGIISKSALSLATKRKIKKLKDERHMAHL